ncbi:MAG: hypothetical protein HQL41_07930, partial [Alphaproteobacteria bacterium]|nr:hypothetical protein [Alphaproteobacteria bacterium]
MLNKRRGMRVVALLRTPEAKEAVDRALAGVAGIAAETTMGSLAAVGPALGGAQPPSLTLVDVDLDDDAEMNALAAMIAGGAGMVVVTSARASLPGMRRLMRLGITDLLPQPIQAPDVLSAVQAAIDAARGKIAGRGAAEGVAIGLLKAGGGAGTTTLAVQAACALGHGADPAGICVLDLDPQFGAAALHLDLPQRVSMLDLLADPERLDASMLRSSAARHKSGVDLLAAPPGVQRIDGVAPEDAAALVRIAREEYRLVLVDLPLAWTAWTRAALTACDAVAVVLRLDVPSVHHARRQLETLAEEGLDHIPVALIANRVER